MIEQIILFLNENRLNYKFEGDVRLGIAIIYFFVNFIILALTIIVYKIFIIKKIKLKKFIFKNINLIFIAMMYIGIFIERYNIDEYFFIYLIIFMCILSCINFIFYLFFDRKLYFNNLLNYIFILFLFSFMGDFAMALVCIITMVYLTAVFYKKILLLLALYFGITLLFILRFYGIYLFDLLVFNLLVFAPVVLFIFMICRLCLQSFKIYTNKKRKNHT